VMVWVGEMGEVTEYPTSSCGDACGSTNPWFRVPSENPSSTDVSVRLLFGCSSCSPSPCPDHRDQLQVGVATQLGQDPNRG
jgi:hypothetical protein